MTDRRRLKIPIDWNVIDRAVAWVDPTRGARRLADRVRMAVAGSYVSARRDRRSVKNWNTSAGDADADLIPDLPTIRQQCRDLDRNNPLARGAINTVTTSSVGQGLSLQCEIDAETLGLTQEEAADWEATTEREFGAWAADPKACDAAKTLDFYAQQKLIFRSAKQSGDCFVLLPYVADPRVSHYRLRLHVIEADRCSNPGFAMDTPELCAGVKIGTLGEPLSYFFQKRHPGALTGYSAEWDEVLAFGPASGRRQVLHLFDKMRPGLTRGEPYLAPVIEALKGLGDYTEAEIKAAVVAAFFTVFVETPGAEGLDTGDMDGNVSAANAEAGSDVKMDSGAIIDLEPGAKVQTANPTRPNTAFDPFVEAILRQIGVALELPFEILIKHFTASYSAARAALLEAWRFFRGQRAWLTMMICEPVYEAWLDEAVSIGRIVAPGYFDDPSIRRAYLGSSWHGDAPGQVNPTNETDAAGKRMELLLSTHQEECAELTGGNWLVKIRKRAREERLIEKLELAKQPPAPAGPPAPPGSTQPKIDSGKPGAQDEPDPDDEDDEELPDKPDGLDEE